MATSVERVRLVINDKLRIQRKEAEGDGVSRFYQMDHQPIQDETVWFDDVITTAYTLDATNGIIEFTSATTVNVKITFQYYAAIWTDAEISEFLDMYGDNINITAGQILMAWAADAARLAKRQTLAGGGGLGAATIDTSVAARELRNSAKALLDWEVEYGETAGAAIPAEGLTEIPWTEAAYENTVGQRIIRES